MRLSTLLPTILGVALLASGAFPALAQGGNLAKMFDRADLNHDGVVTRAEFAASRTARFQALDRNHDGYLTREDVPPMAVLLRPDAAKMMDALAPFDTDHDGRISLAEFVAGSMRLFDQADANHNGVLTRAEAAAAATRIKAELHLSANSKP